MSLQLILGGSGSGKSHYLYHKIISGSIEFEKTNFLVIVPEQFTMQTQKDLVAMHPYHGVMNIDILSFLRLAYRVFDETGGNDKQVLDDTGKSMILRKVVERKKQELCIFSASVKKKGFVEELKSLLSEIFQYSIKEEQIGEMIAIAEGKPMFQGKLRDILTVYQGFKEYLSEKFITSEEILDLLNDMVGKSEFIKNSVIVFDGFTGFTPSQYKLLAKLMKLAKKVYVTVTIDPREDISRVDEEFKLFHLSKKTIHKLYQLAREERVEIEEEYYPEYVKGNVPFRFRESEALASLESNLFRYPSKAFEKAQDDIQLHLLNEPKQEVYFTVREIEKLVWEEGYRYQDIAVVTGDIETYGRMIEKEYKLAGFPFFIDSKKEILSNPLVELIRSVLEICRKDFDYESVFRYLRCGLANLTAVETDKLENYVIAMGIRGYKKWNEPWKRNFGKDREVDLEEINLLRDKVMMHLGMVREGVPGKSHKVIDITKIIYEFIVQLQVYEKLESYREEFEEKGDLLKAKEYVQIYTVVMNLFERMVELLGEEVVSTKEYLELMETGFLEVKVGMIPPGVDQIVVGDIERTRLKDIKALFFIGVNDGIIPKSGASGGIISDIEREMLSEHQLELAPTKRQCVYTEQFYLYLNLTKPQNKLYLTYSKTGAGGKALRPSYLIGKVKKLFPKLSVIDEDVFVEGTEYILGADMGLTYLLSGLRDFTEEKMPPAFWELYRWYFQKEDFRGRLEKFVEGAFYISKESRMSKAVAEVLYGKQMTGSITRLELYAACAYAHFINYGLLLRERQEYKIGVPDLGNIFHAAIELYSKKLKEKNLSWREVSGEQRDELARQCVQEASLDYGNTVLLSSSRNEYIITRVERMVKRTLWALTEHVKKGGFEPKGYEISFSFLNELSATKVSLSDDEAMYLRGRIDRMDTYETEDKICVRVIDYKSGSTTFDVLELYYGLRLQLVVYLNAAIELERRNNPDKAVIPAGIFYYNIADPIVEKGSNDEVSNGILKELKMNGLVNSDVEIIKQLDRSFHGEDGGLNPSVKSLVVPVETGKDGRLTANSNVVNQKGFEAMTSYVNDKMKEYGNSILSGNIMINPYKLGAKTACDYCSYSGICGFDKRLPGYEYRNLRKLKKEDIWRCIYGEGEVDNGSAKGD